MHRNIPEIPTPLLLNNQIFLIRDGGILSAVDSSNGKVQYRKRLQAAGHYSASPVAANGHVYLASEKGIVSVVKAGKTFDLTAQFDFSEPISATPAFDDRTVYIRTKNHLYAFRSSEAP